MIEQQNKGDMQNIQKQVGAAMRRIRKAHGQTLLHLAAQSGTDLSYLSHVERGMHNLTVAKLYELCQAMNIRMSEFFLAVERSEHQRPDRSARAGADAANTAQSKPSA